MIKGSRGQTSRTFTKIAVLAGLCATLCSAFAEDSPEINFHVERFNVLGQLPFAESKVAGILEPFVGEHSGLEGLQAAGDALESELRKEGFAFFEVSLPPQTLAEGIVSLEVVQQRIGQVRVSGHSHFDEDNIKTSVPTLLVGLPPNTREISRSVSLANENPSKDIKVSFAGGSRPGEVDATIKVEDSRQWNFFTSLSNTGNTQTGKWRNTLGFQHNNVFERDHSYGATLTYSPGEESTLAQLGLSYRIPFYQLKGALSFFLSRSESDVTVTQNAGGAGGAFDLNNLGAGQFSGLNYSQALLAVGRYRHNVGIGIEDKLVNGRFFRGGQLIQQNARTRSTPIKLYYDMSYSYAKNSWSAQLQYAKNLELNNYNDQKDYDAVVGGTAIGAPKVDWDVWRATVYQDIGFGPSWIWRLQLTGQASNERLISLEQYGMGGLSTVRGYSESILRGDNALLARNELWLKPLTKSQIRPVLFYDWGQVTESVQAGGATNVRTQLAGYGAGIRWQWKKQVSAQLDVARARDTIAGSGSRVDAGDVRGHFSLFARF